MMRKLGRAALGIALLAGTCSTPVRADIVWMRDLLAARAALASGDRASAARRFTAADSVLAGHAGAKAALAGLAALDGRHDDALRWLQAYAATGLAKPAFVDTAFRLWGAEPAFRAIAARLDSNAAPIVRSQVIHSLGDSSLLAEDLVWDARSRRFLVSSIHRGKIVAVDARGVVRDFVASGQPGAWGYYGLAIDPPRGLLWASSAAGAECDGFQAADSGRTALFAFRLADGALVRRVELPRMPTRQVLGDLAVGPDGTVCAGESVGGMVYRLRPGSDSLEPIVPPGTLRSPQQPAFAADGRRIYVPDYSRGVALVDPATKAVRWLPKPYSLASVGFDGLCRRGNKLIAVQNGLAPHRVLELTLDPRGDAITGWRVLEQASPRMGEPNHGIVVGDHYWFIGDSGWERVGDDDRLLTPPTARSPVLLRMPIEVR